MTGDDGALLFARFAYPPNELGYCGPDRAGELLERTAVGASGRGLRQLVRGFDGAWPYLELIAAANGVPDPLDRAVVEAYWVGNALLDRVPAPELARSVADRFAGRAGRDAERLLAPVVAGAVPHHAFHVFAVYPWVGLLRSGRVGEPLHVLDRCRVRWGRVTSVVGDRAVVRSRPLEWDGRVLRLGRPREEVARTGESGLSLVPGLAAGDWCALHWDWVCEVLTPERVRALARMTTGQLGVVNAAAVPPPATVLS